MAPQLSKFLEGYQRGIEVGVAAGSPEELLGVRDGFLRFFHEGLERSAPVAVVPHEVEHRHRGIAQSDVDALGSARWAARELARRLEETYQFYVAGEVCVQDLVADEGRHLLLRSWIVVIGPPGETIGASASLELPRSLVEGLEPHEVAVKVPGSRRRGGLMARLTGGLETRRDAVAVATLNALSTLFFGILESPRGSLPRRPWTRRSL